MLSRLCRYSLAAAIGALATSQVLLAQNAKAEKAEPSGNLTLEDLLSVESVGAPVLSPDGSQFAFTRGEQILLMPLSPGRWLAGDLSATTAGGKSGFSGSPGWAEDRVRESGRHLGRSAACGRRCTEAHWTNAPHGRRGDPRNSGRS